MFDKPVDGGDNTEPLAADTADATLPPDDEIMAELRARRETLLAAAGYDLHEYVRRARVALAKSGRRVVSRSVQSAKSEPRGGG